jgi:hypothetical protein
MMVRDSDESPSTILLSGQGENMIFGQVKHVSQLEIGEVVRMIRSLPSKVVGIAPVSYAAKNGESIVVEGTKNYLPPVIGAADDFRQAYDTMTVAERDDATVLLVRPYFHVHADGSLGAIGTEMIRHNRVDARYYFEVLK